RELPRKTEPGFEPGAVAQIEARAGFSDRPRRESRPAGRQSGGGRGIGVSPRKPATNPLDLPYVTPPAQQIATKPVPDTRQTRKKPIPALLMRPPEPLPEGN
ncbi:MAG TPA: RNA helicase, partial [Sulfuricella sp.]|nr:RNA helicase [Sulfuricella sp.]